MHSRHALLGVGTAAALALALAATPAQAVVTFNSDDAFLDSRFADAEEFAVVQGQSGRNANNDAESVEAQIFSNGGASSTNFSGFWQDDPVNFTASYDGNSLSFTGRRAGFELFNIDRAVVLTGAESIFLRAAADTNSSTSLTDLEFAGTSLPDISASGASAEQYLGFNYANLDGSWTLSGTATLEGVDSNARPGFQVKFTDAVVPLPAAAWLMISGLAGVGYTAYRRKASAAA